MSDLHSESPYNFGPRCGLDTDREVTVKANTDEDSFVICLQCKNHTLMYFHSRDLYMNFC